ncbi:MAG: ABC transporter permease [Candidatus Aenigmatarchaeota archaeon]
MEEIFKIAFRNLSHQKARTVLTLLGVIVGIASVVALISLGSGLSTSVAKQLEQIGTDKIIIIPKTSGGFGPPTGFTQKLSEKDLDIVKKTRGVDIAIPILLKNLPVSYEKKTSFITIYGVSSKESKIFFSGVQRYTLDEGRFMKEDEKSVAIIGSRVHTDIFGNEIRVGDKIKILGKEIRVIGIMKPTGNQQDDNGIIIPIETLRDIIGDKEDITVIFAKAYEDPKIVAERIEKELEDLHNEKLFFAMTTEQLLERINSIFSIISIVLAGIAGISLLVASFGILNTMLMAVIERTKEIGVMKAIGATNRRILALFLIESSFVGLIGGVVGTIVGYSLSLGFSKFATNIIGLSLNVEIDPMLIIGAILFSMIVGMVSGTYPAYRAAKLDPVEALRYE